MPIRPENAGRYPPGWRRISDAVRFGRAQGRCEWRGCRARHGRPHPETGSRVVLTTAHVWNAHPEDCRPTNLLALCQLHHLRLDAAQHRANAARTRRAHLAAGDLFETGAGHG